MSDSNGSLISQILCANLITPHSRYFIKTKNPDSFLSRGSYIELLYILCYLMNISRPLTMPPRLVAGAVVPTGCCVGTTVIVFCMFVIFFIISIVIYLT